MSINESLSKCNWFCVKVGETNITAQSVSKFYDRVRSRLRQKMHKLSESDLIGVEINERFGSSSIEIDENKIISHANEIFWMFGYIDRNSKKERVRCELTDRSKNRLLASCKKICKHKWR